MEEQTSPTAIMPGLNGQNGKNGHKPTATNIPIADDLAGKDLKIATREKNVSVLNDWQTYTLTDAYQERPPVQYVAGNLFELPSLNVVYSTPGSLKSFLLADLCCCVVVGFDWLQPLPDAAGCGMTVTQNPSIWIDFDNGLRRTHERFGALGRAYKLGNDAPLSYYSMPSPRLDAKNKDQIKDLVGLITERDAKLIVIDNLGTISGDADENSAEMVGVLANLRTIAEGSGAAIVLVHHCRKAKEANSRRGDMLRGHSSIEAALDQALLVERDINSKTIAIIPTKTRGSDVDPFSAMFTYEHDSKGQLQEARFFAGSDVDILTKGKIMKSITTCLGADTINKTTLTEQVHKVMKDTGLNRIRDVIDSMVTEKYLIATRGKYNAQLLTRNPAKTYGSSTVLQAEETPV